MAKLDDFFSGDLSAQNVNLTETGWYSSFGKDFVILHNPVYRYQNHQPYKLDQVAMIYCEKGMAKGSVNLTPYCLKPGGMLIVLSGHIMESYEVSEDFAGTHIFMSERFLSRLDIGDSYKFYDAVERNPYIQLHGRACDAMEKYFDMCHAMLEIKEDNPNTEEALRLQTKVFFFMMGWFLHQEAFSQTLSDRPSDTMGRFLNLVKKNYQEHRDVEFYAGTMNMTAKYLSSVVKKTSGKTPLEWIENYVILDAKAQLSSTMNTVQQIAWNLNFPSQSFFGRYFKRIVGMTPSDYRANVREHKSFSETVR